MLRALAAAAAVSVTGASCVAPPVHFFADPPPNHDVFTAFTDTVLVVRHAPEDSVSAGGVAFAFDVLDGAVAAGETRVARLVRAVLDAVPREARLRGKKPGDHNGDLYLRVQGQSLTQRFDMMRADALSIHAVSSDTVEVVVDDGEEGVVERWLALVLRGEAAANPAIGIR